MMNQSWLATWVLKRINQIENGKKKKKMMLYKFNKFFFFWDSKWRKKIGKLSFKESKWLYLTTRGTSIMKPENKIKNKQNYKKLEMEKRIKYEFI